MVEGNIDGSGEKMQQLREAGNRRSVPTVRRSQLPKWAKEVSGKKWGKQKLGENRDNFLGKNWSNSVSNAVATGRVSRLWEDDAAKVAASCSPQIISLEFNEVRLTN